MNQVFSIYLQHSTATTEKTEQIGRKSSKLQLNR